MTERYRGPQSKPAKAFSAYFNDSTCVVRISRKWLMWFEVGSAELKGWNNAARPFSWTFFDYLAPSMLANSLQAVYEYSSTQQNVLVLYRRRRRILHLQLIGCNQHGCNVQFVHSWLIPASLVWVWMLVKTGAVDKFALSVMLKFWLKGTRCSKLWWVGFWNKCYKFKIDFEPL